VRYRNRYLGGQKKAVVSREGHAYLRGTTKKTGLRKKGEETMQGNVFSASTEQITQPRRKKT